ncbi:hypothetical protein [Glycomyces terrestris]|uniref:Type II toxin-antitoxin system PemK/MazF family toxin n=1 Tax=Glycomyces terrestris TaxID=2493553 RepID=A0A426UZQ6_9ACTN|nr:hypothetical protein [Glycomyces terrestris]RRS00084.1 hypothetical protein EIW28_05645 [Glycomyces terrestris]
MISLDPGTLLFPLLVLAAGLVVLVVVLRRRAAPTRAPGAPRLDAAPPVGGPQNGERWLADVPFEDEPRRSKERPVLVIGYSGRGYWVLKCTTQEPREAEWRVAAPANRWDPPADKDGWVDLVPVHLPRGRFDHAFGRIGDPGLYRKITGRLRWERAVDFTR